MSSVFFLFLAGSVTELVAITCKAIGGTFMYTFLGISSIALALLGAYLTAFGLRIRPQYSDDLIKAIESKKKDLVMITDVRQRKGFIWWGLACLSIAALIQFCLLVVSRGQ